MRNQSCCGPVPHVWGECSAFILTRVPQRPASPVSLPRAVPFPKSPIWSMGQFLMVHLLCFKY